MDALLTVRALQDLLHVDRTTIYRMLQEDRLPGFKVGGQWRFSRPEIEVWLAEQQLPQTDGPDGASHAGSSLLPIHCLQPIQGVFAEAMDVGALTTSPDGALITTMSSPAPFCSLVTGSAEGMRRCVASWSALGRHQAGPPELARCHAGLCYARGQVHVGGQNIAMVFAGQFRLLGDGVDAKRVTALAMACDIRERELLAAAAAVREVEPAHAAKALRLLQVVADTFSSIGEERQSLVSRLKRISEMSTL